MPETVLGTRFVTPYPLWWGWGDNKQVNNMLEGGKWFKKRLVGEEIGNAGGEGWRVFCNFK